MSVDSREFKEVADNPPRDDTLFKIHNQWKVQSISVGGIKLRAGLFPAKTLPPKANVLYLEGLADSMFNHDKLFNTLSKAGYQIIAFDYPGQGGSEGSMNQTRITATESNLSLDELEGLLESDKKEDNIFGKFMDGFKKHKSESIDTFLIRDMADIVWEKIKSINGIDSKKQIDAVIGWSTGGVAGYEMAKDKKEGLKGIILIAPGIHAKPVIEITTDTLNGNSLFKHLDNIRPDSPLKILGFTQNLLASGLVSQNWEVTHDIKGLVLLSDPKRDIYVDSKKVEKTLRRNTISNNFEFVNYTGAAHEIDNETEEHRTAGNIKLEFRVVKFLDKVFS